MSNNIIQAEGDTIKLDSKIYSLLLDGDVPAALKMVERIDTAKLKGKDKDFVLNLENRFKYKEDKSTLPQDKSSKLNGLFMIFKNYWRKSLLNDSKNYDDELIKRFTKYLSENYKPAKKLNSKSDDDTINKMLKGYLESLGYNTTGYGRTGKFLDLLIWKIEKDTNYSFDLSGEQTDVNVVLMDDFYTLGWEEYATLGRNYPGGWAGKDKLFCVASAYDMNSENFKISYLAHESRHFADYKLFPKLTGADLEYRAKLTELSLADETLFRTINFFIHNSNYESDSPHSIANYCVIRDMSRLLFSNEFEKDIEKWKAHEIKTINDNALKLLKENTEALNKEGENVEKFIKK